MVSASILYLTLWVTTDNSPVSLNVQQLLNYGVIGLFFIAALFGYIYLKPSVDDIKKERDRAIHDKSEAEKQRDQAVQIAQEKFVPLLTTMVDNMKIFIPLLQAVVTRQDNQNQAFERHKQEQERFNRD